MSSLKKLLSVSLVTISTLSFTACDKLSSKPKIECNNESGLNAVLSSISQNAETAIKSEKSDTSISAIRAAINSLKFSTKNVRISKQDPNSTKVFCEAEFVITSPINIIENANTALKSAGETKDINLILEDYGLKPSANAANSYEGTIAYNLQPTDDGKTILANIDDGNDQIISSIKDIILWSMAKNTLNKDNVQAVATNNSDNRANIGVANNSAPATMVAPKMQTETGLICSYQANISDNDKFNSSGKPIATTYSKASVAAILRQDRANFHKFNLRDNGDTSDCLMSSAEQRATFEKLISNGQIDNAVINAVIDGNPTIKVDLYANHANVSLN